MAKSTEQILSLVQVPKEVKYNLNKWTFYSLKRAGFDPYAYLIWLQTQNKNSLDFRLILGGLSDITREEYLFKSFIAQTGYQKDGQEAEIRSSKRFYKFLSFIRRN